MANQVPCGGWNGTEDATEETQKICDAVKDQVEEETNQKYVVYKAVKYRLQVVAGLKLTIKVFAGEEDYIHLSVFQPLLVMEERLSWSTSYKETPKATPSALFKR
ncbi:hypothetical protein CgunFtcFv8_015327 [Champsocephalus gunnari]|uniref:Cystatin-B n=1 Tax=Champsocephalus gunnari TaxID=52237 RepID=A0AAN8H094_CHAGU|nr:hypothetical protein CgunFtcFv8_015327 [Champsocephalus gunnari]